MLHKPAQQHCCRQVNCWGGQAYWPSCRASMHSLGRLLYSMGSLRPFSKQSSLTREKGICFGEPECDVAPRVPRCVKHVHGLLSKLPGVTILRAAQQSAPAWPHQPGAADFCQLGTTGLDSSTATRCMTMVCHRTGGSKSCWGTPQQMSQCKRNITAGPVMAKDVRNARPIEAPGLHWTAHPPVQPAECGVPRCNQKPHNCGACLEGNVDAWNAPLISLWPHDGTVELLLEGLIAACEAGALPLKEGARQRPSREAARSHHHLYGPSGDACSECNQPEAPCKQKTPRIGSAHKS